MTRIAILDDYQNVALGCADWAALPGCDTRVFDHHLGFDEDAIAAALAGFEVIVAMRERTPFPASLLRRLPNLRLLVTTGMRNLAVDMDEARARGVDVCGTAMLPHPAFELTWALILGLMKNIPREDRSMREGGWQVAVARGLRGKTLGVLGLGKLGAQTAAIGKAFGMNVVAWSQNLTGARAEECGVRRVDKDLLFRESDVISVHLVLSERTRGLVGAAEFGAMKSDAVIVNTSRGPIVDEAALVDALQARRIGGAGIDVYDVEPLPADHPLRSLDNTVLTGHTGYVIDETFALAYREAAEDIAAWLDGAPVRLLN